MKSRNSLTFRQTAKRAAVAIVELLAVSAATIPTSRSARFAQIHGVRAVGVESAA